MSHMLDDDLDNVSVGFRFKASWCDLTFTADIPGRPVSYAHRYAV